jgi:hypothetical protein
VNEIGVFVRINGTSLVGLARKATALQDSSKALQEEYQVGDVVRAKVLRVSASTLKIALGLRESYFRNESLEEEEESGSDEEQVEDSDDEDVIQLGGDDDDDDDDEEEDDNEEDDEDEDEEEDVDEDEDVEEVSDYDEDDIGEEVEEQITKEVKSVSKVRLTYILFINSSIFNQLFGRAKKERSARPLMLMTQTTKWQIPNRKQPRLRMTLESSTGTVA